MVAQQLQALLPQLVVEGLDGLLQVKEAQLVYLLLGSIRELHVVVDGQGVRLQGVEWEQARLRGELGRLQAMVGCLLGEVARMKDQQVRTAISAAAAAGAALEWEESVGSTGAGDGGDAEDMVVEAGKYVGEDIREGGEAADPFGGGSDMEVAARLLELLGARARGPVAPPGQEVQCE